MRHGNVEFRWSGLNKAYELLLWDGDTCIVTAFFDKGEEGYDMRTVGARFFLDKDSWMVAKHAMSFLEELFASEDSSEQLD